MGDARLLQFHWLASYPATLLNRDDAGLAKRMPFGGCARARVSSQCLKRHWRLAGALELEHANANPWAIQNLSAPMGVRTKRVVEDRIMPRARAQQSASEEVAEAVKKAMITELYGDKALDEKKRQALFFGEPEIAHLSGKAAEALSLEDATSAAAALKGLFKNERANMKGLKGGAGLESALFGRMVTSDPAANTDAAIHVAHAMTVHAIERELDFMTVVDDLKAERDDADAGAAGVFDMELTSGLYYGYAVVDVALLVSNLGGDREIAAKVVEHLVHLTATVTPGAKKGSTAPYAWAELMLIEAGARQPRTLANAFRDPVKLKTNRLLGETVERMQKHMAGLDEMYGAGEARRQAGAEERLPAINAVSLDNLAHWAADCVRTGQAV
ncbi:MAG: type I-E CRISPR-associated protein Cas7/Cse4/CasC [Hyphomicrobiales bacterium]|nr:type I-E CRISPR-associated protein Cas7/Cse4/CasC [Hyphomicrobiales bacterium]